MSTSKHLVLVGAGHAHLTTLTSIEQFSAEGFRVTVVNPGTYQYYSGMGPGLLSGYYHPGEARFNVAAMAEAHGAAFVQNSVVRIDAVNRVLRLSGGAEMEYDVASFGIGSEIGTAPLDANPTNVVTVKPVEHLFELRCRVRADLRDRPVRVVVVGGGAAGVELAANLVPLSMDRPNPVEVTLLTRRGILRQFPERLRRRAAAKLKMLGVRVEENAEVAKNTADTIETDSGQTFDFEYLLLASGTRPPRLFQESGVPVGDTGGLAVDEYLRSPEFPSIFGGGDCIDFLPRPVTKVGVYAVKENPILLHNLMATLRGNPLKAFVPQKHFHLILNMGDGTGLSYRKPIMITGGPAFRLKDRIDSAFMRKFQESGEIQEIVECPEGS